MHVIRPGESIQYIPGYGMRVTESGVAVAATSNWWEVSGKTCVAAYQPKGAASYAASLINLTGDDTYDATEGVAPTWATGTGWTFDGTDDYLNTGVNPVGTWSMFIAYNTAGAGVICGRRTASLNNSYYLVPVGGAGERVAQNDGQYLRVSSGAKTAGVYGLAYRKAYMDGISDGEMLSTLALTGTLPIYVGGVNNNGTLVPCSCIVVAFAVWSDTLSDSEAATVSTAMAAL